MAEGVNIPSGSIKVRAPDNTITTIPAEQLPLAMGSGYTIPTDGEVARYEAQQQALSSPLDKLAALGVGVADAPFMAGTFAANALGAGETWKELKANLPSFYEQGLLGGGVALGAGAGSALSFPSRFVAGRLGGGLAATVAAEAGEGAAYNALFNVAQQMAEGNAPFDEEQLYAAVLSGGLFTGAVSGALRGPIGAYKSLRGIRPGTAQRLADAEAGLLTPDQMLEVGGELDHSLHKPIVKGAAKVTKGVTSEVESGAHASVDMLSDLSIDQFKKATNLDAVAERAAGDAQNFSPSAFIETSRTLGSKFMRSVREWSDDIADGTLKKQRGEFHEKLLPGRISAAANELAVGDAVQRLSLLEDYYVPRKDSRLLMSALKKLDDMGRDADVSVTPRELFETVQSIDEQLGKVHSKLRNKLHNSLGDVDPRVATQEEYFANFRKDFNRAFVESPDLWNSNWIQRFQEVKKATAKAVKANGDFAKKFAARGGGDKQGLAKFALSLKNADGDARMGPRSSTYMAIKEVIEANKALEDVAKKYGYEAPVSGTTGRLQKLLDTVDDNRLAGRAHDELATVSREEKRSIAMEAIAATGMTAALYPMVGMYAPIGLGAVLAWRMARMPGQTMRMAFALSNEVGKRMNNVGQGIQKLEKSAHVSSMPKMPKMETLSLGQPVATLNYANQGSTKEKADAVIGRLASSVGNDALIRSEVHARLGANEKMWNANMGAAAKALQARDYILSLAKSPSVSGRDALRIMQSIEGLRDFDKLFEKAAKGELTPAMGNALRAVMPKEWERMRGHVMETVAKLASEGKVLPRQQRLALSVAFKLPLDARLSPSYVLKTTAVHMPPDGMQQQNQQQQAPDISHLYEDKSEVVGRNTREDE